MRRPNPALWLWYAYGGRLPDRYREWVRHDATAPNWLPRQLARVAAQALPLLVLLFVLLRLFTRAPTWGIIGMLLVGMLLTLFFMIGMARPMVRVRLARHDFPPDVDPPPSRLIPDDAEREPR